jgi:hypothetical protein
VKQYRGIRSHGQAFVAVDGRPLDPRFDLRFHSPDGFEWGYGGSGPAQLALALLVDHLGDTAQALALYHDFKFALVAGLPREEWTLTSEQIQQVIDALPSPAQQSCSEKGAENSSDSRAEERRL